MPFALRLIVNRYTIRKEDPLGDTVAALELNALFCLELQQDVSLVACVAVVQLCYPSGFLSERSGGFPLLGWSIPAQFSIYFHPKVLRTRGQFIALLTLTVYALQSLVMAMGSRYYHGS